MNQASDLVALIIVWTVCAFIGAIVGPQGEKRPATVDHEKFNIRIGDQQVISLITSSRVLPAASDPAKVAPSRPRQDVSVQG